MFLIPYNKLTDPQKEIIRRVSKESNNLFIEGPPGSGKTLISLYTLRDMVENKVSSPLVLIYNHSLYGYLSTSFEELGISDNITIATKDKFFWDLANHNNIEALKEDKKYEEKYDFILTKLLKANLTKKWNLAVVDEVQDFNQKEWKLIQTLCGQITSMGDFNQGIYESDLNKTDITSISQFEKLFDIFRFHKNIAKVANRFSKQNDDLVKKVKKIDSKQVQIIDVGNKEQEVLKVSEIVKSLLKQKKSIGIISPSRKELQNMQEELEKLDVDCLFLKNNQDFKNHDFTSNNKPLLITSLSAKGLEFENVIVFGFDSDNYAVIANKNLKETIYVSLTRANSGLYIVRNPNTIPELRVLKQEMAEEKVEVTIDDIFG